MSKLLSRLKIKNQILAGSGVVLCLLVLVCAISIFNFQLANHEFDELDHAAKEASVAAKIETWFFKLHSKASSFAKVDSQATTETFQKIGPELSQFLAQAKELFKEDKHTEKLAEIEAALAEYFDEFNELSAAYRAQEELLHESVRPSGKKLLEDLDALMSIAIRSGNLDAVSFTSQATKHLLLAKSYLGELIAGINDHATERLRLRLQRLERA